MRGLVVVCFAMLACERAHPPVDAPLRGLELRARDLIEALERGNPDPLVAIFVDDTTWDGISPADNMVTHKPTRREQVIAIGAAAVAFTGEFRRVAFVWTEDEYVYVLTEHAHGDFVYMVRFDAEQKLRHLTYSTPDRLHASTACTRANGELLDDGTILIGPTRRASPSVAIVGMLGGRPHSVLAHELANELTCRGIASIVVPDSKPLRELPPGVRVVVAHPGDRALVPPGIEPLLVAQALPPPRRDSGRSVIDSAHVAFAVVEQVAARTRRP